MGVVLTSYTHSNDELNVVKQSVVSYLVALDVDKLAAAFRKDVRYSHICKQI